jgi:hypothetical protein
MLCHESKSGGNRSRDPDGLYSFAHFLEVLCGPDENPIPGPDDNRFATRRNVLRDPTEKGQISGIVATPMHERPYPEGLKRKGHSPGESLVAHRNAVHDRSSCPETIERLGENAFPSLHLADFLEWVKQVLEIQKYGNTFRKSQLLPPRNRAGRVEHRCGPCKLLAHSLPFLVVGQVSCTRPEPKYTPAGLHVKSFLHSGLLHQT